MATNTNTSAFTSNINPKDTLYRMQWYEALYKEDGFHILPDEFGIELEVLNVPDEETFVKCIDWSKTRFLWDVRMPKGGILQLAPVRSVSDDNFVTVLDALLKSKAVYKNCGCLITLLFGDKTMIHIEINGTIANYVDKMLREVRYWRDGIHKEDRVAWNDKENCYIVC